MPLTDMARNWYGYGRWDAPYWFIGLEPGMAISEGDDLWPRFKAWRELGGHDLIDCAAHYRGFGYSKWHTGLRPPTQPTWRQLIRLLLAFKRGHNPTNEMIRQYQCNQWGVADGETAVLELSGLAARNVKTERDRAACREQRVEFLRAKILEFQPVFVVMYGTSARAEWECIAGGPFDRTGMRPIGLTITFCVPHPVAVGLCNQDWVKFGRRLRRHCEKLHLQKPGGLPNA